MPRAIWKGHVSFGLVQIPVVLHSAEKRDELHFRLLDRRDHARIRYERVNEVSGEPVSWDDVVKAFEYDDNNYVVLTDEDFRRAAVEATQTVGIDAFVDLADISPLFFDKPYYLAPGKHGVKGYALLREAMRRAGKAGIARVVIRSRQYLSALIVQDGALVLMLLRYADELRETAELDLPGKDLKKQGVTPKEVSMAEDLVEAMADDWKPEQYRDEYRDALMSWIEKKAQAGGAMPAAEEPSRPAKQAVINITDLLQKSLGERRGDKSKPAARSTRTRKPAAHRRAPARRKAG